MPPDQRERASGLHVVVADASHLAMDFPEALAHVRGHAEGDGPCDDCPASVDLRIDSALPDQFGRLPGHWRTSDLLWEYDELHYDVRQDVIARLETAQALASLLEAIR